VGCTPVLFWRFRSQILVSRLDTLTDVYGHMYRSLVRNSGCRWSWKSRAIPLLPLWSIRPVQSLSACTRMTFTFNFIPILKLTHYLLWLFMLRVMTRLHDTSIDTKCAGQSRQNSDLSKNSVSCVRSRRGTRYTYRQFCHHYWLTVTNWTAPHSYGQLSRGCHTEWFMPPFLEYLLVACNVACDRGKNEREQRRDYDIVRPSSV